MPQMQTKSLEFGPVLENNEPNSHEFGYLGNLPTETSSSIFFLDNLRLVDSRHSFYGWWRKSVAMNSNSHAISQKSMPAKSPPRTVVTVASTTIRLFLRHDSYHR